MSRGKGKGMGMARASVSPVMQCAGEKHYGAVVSTTRWRLNL